MNHLTLQRKLEETFNLYKDNIAVEQGNRRVTYAELDRKSDFVFNWITNQYIKPGTFIGIFMDDKIEIISAVIGILKAGCVFVPLDSVYPGTRLEIMIRTTDIKYIISDRINVIKLKAFDTVKKQKVKCVIIGDLYFEETRCLKQEPGMDLTPEDKIYIYFTSGTTGIPKAVLGKNKSLLHFIEWEIGAFKIDETFRVSQFANPGFDVFLRDIFVPLCAGGTICIPQSKEILLSNQQLVRWVESSKINLIHCVPSLFRLFYSDESITAAFKHLEYILLAGERLNPQDIQKWYSVFDTNVQLVNLYGPTETTLAKLFYLIRETDMNKEIIPVGKPIPGARVIILDENMEVCDQLELGELHIRTPFRTFGYYNDPLLNKQKFIQNPFSSRPDDIIYKTGDLGRILPDGNIELIGRIDRQVKVRGMRIELEDIESTLTKHPSVKEAVVINKEIPDRDVLLVAFVTTTAENMGEEKSLDRNIKEFLFNHLPDYMVPPQIKKIEKIPRKPNLKVDFDALYEWLESERQDYIPPGNDIERKLVNIWSHLLGIKRIGITDNFMELGGNSLNIMSLISEIYKEFNTRISLNETFNNLVLGKQAALIERATKEAYVPIEPVEKKTHYALSSAQKRLYVIQQMQLDSTNYNVWGAVILEGELDRDKFEKVFRKLIHRHESLRTSFKFVGDQPVQEIHHDPPFAVDYYAVISTTIDDIIKKFIRPFDLSKAPLLRGVIIKIEDAKYLFVFDWHHIITDGTSIGIFTREFMLMYAGVRLPSLKIQYKDYWEWLSRIGKKKARSIKKQEEYWLSMLQGEISKMDLPTDYARPALQSFEGNSIHFEINREDTNSLKIMALEEDATLYMILLAIYNVFLAKLTNQEDIFVGMPVSGRSHPDLERIIGMFVNNLVLRNDVTGHQTFIGFLKQVKKTTLTALENQEYQYEDLVEKVEVNRDASRNPLFDVVFVFHNMDISEVEISGLTLKPYSIKRDESKFDLTLQGWEAEGKLLFAFEYRTKLFKKTTIETFISYFKKIVSIVTRVPGEKISSIEVISEQEKREMVFDFNETGASYPAGKTLDRLFEEQAGRSPGHIALIRMAHGAARRAIGVGTRFIASNMHITYKELNKKSNQLAHLLRSKGAGPGGIIGIMVEHPGEMISGMLGILKAGCAYLPLDPEYPEERIDFMLRDSASKILLTRRDYSNKIKFEKEIIYISDAINRVPTPPSSHLQLSSAPASAVSTTTLTSNSTCQVGPANLVYIIFTSGTTGRPKGVMIEHRNVVRLLINDKFQFNFNHCDVWTMFHSFCFDFSVWEMYGALLYGGKLILISKKESRDTPRYLEILKAQKVTVLNQTPSAFYNLMELELRESTRHLKTRYVIFGGEALSPGRLKQWQEKYPETKLINMYGITETTVHVTVKEIGHEEIEANMSSIGRPIPTLSVYIMDRYLKLQPIGVAGELCVGGDGVSRGYLNRPGLTIEKFQPNPFKQGDMIYKSGDLAKLYKNGEMEYLGRIDQQVKIRGFRIEPGEIECKLLKNEKIKEAVVLAKEDKSANRYLCAYFVSSKEFIISELREYLQEELPNYMVPAYFVKLDRLPLTSNGKIDRNALPEPGGIGLGNDVEYTPPRNVIEKKLVEIWEHILGRNRIGIHEDFFMIGGDSIKTIQIASRMNRAGYKIEMKDIFQNPTIAQLVPFVKELDRVPDQSVIFGIVPLTPIQKRFFESAKQAPHHFNQAVMLHWHPHKEERFAEAIEVIFKKLQEHHDALRMTYKESNGIIIQENHGLDYPFSLQVFDFRNQENAMEALEAGTNEVQASIDLENGPLMKLGLFHLDDGDRLLIAAHHLVIDGVSWRILFEDIETLYRQYKRGKQWLLPLKTDSFKLWAEKLSAFANSETFLKEKKYWADLDSTVVFPIKKDFEAGDNYVKDTANLSFSLSEEETGLLLTRANRAFGTEINDLLLTALGLAARKTCGHNRLLIALEGHGREEILKELNMNRTVGWFTSIYPVILDISYETDLARQIIVVKEMLRAVPHKGVSYGILKYLTQEQMDFKLNPQISFNYMGQFDADLESLSFQIAEESVGQSFSPAGQSEYELEVFGIITYKQLHMTIRYSKKQYKPETLQTLWNHYQSQLSRIILFCSGQKEREFTPCDLTYPGLSIDTFAELKKKYPYPIEDIYPCSPMQEGMLFHALYDRSSSAHFVQMSYRFQGEFDIDAIKKSLSELFNRYQILRTLVIYEGIDRPLQVVLKDRPVDFFYKDIRQINVKKGDEKETFIDQFKIKDRQRSFDLSKDLLLRVAVIRADNEKYEFIFSFHHILMDGWCMSIIFSELLEIYTSCLQHREPRLPPVKPYRIYIRWLENQDKENARLYWKEFLRGYNEPAAIPQKTTTRVRDYDYKQEEVVFTLGTEKTRALNQMAAVNRVTLSVIFQAVWGLLLANYSSRNDVVFGLVVSGRPSEIEGVESMVGLFINTIPVRMRFQGNTTFSQLLRKLQEDALNSEPYHYYSLAEIQANSTVKQDLFDHLLAFLNYPTDPLDSVSDEIKKINLKDITSDEAIERSSFNLDVIITLDEEISIKLKYNANVYYSNFMKNIPVHMVEIIHQVLENDEIKFKDIEFSYDLFTASKDILQESQGDFAF